MPLSIHHDVLRPKIRKRQQPSAARDARYRRTEDAYRCLLDKHQALMSAMTDVIYYVTRNGVYYDYQTNDTALLFMPPEHFLGKNVRELLPPAVAEPAMQAIDRAITTRALQYMEYEIEMYGKTLYRESRIMALSDEEVLVVSHDITDSKRFAQEMQTANEWLAEANARLEMQILRVNEQALYLEMQKRELLGANQRLEELATTDGLTGLKNHRKFQERLLEEFERASRYGTPLSLILLDVDHFKQYNDTYGHPAGDAVLKQVAAVLTTQARHTDMVARYGGEEFAVILPLTKADCALKAAERFRFSLEQAVWPLRAVTGSFGVSTYSLTSPDKAALIDQADKALYCAKQKGRNRVTFYEEARGVTGTHAFSFDES